VSRLLLLAVVRATVTPDTDTVAHHLGRDNSRFTCGKFSGSGEGALRLCHIACNMLRSVILLQLTLWVASIHAFYPFWPSWLECKTENNCVGEPKSEEKPHARGVHTYQLSQRVRDVSTAP
jgi:hypothetical protein